MYFHSDSQRTIHLTSNSIFHSRSKYIELPYHFIESVLENGVSILVKIQGTKNPTDMLTKVNIIVK